MKTYGTIKYEPKFQDTPAGWIITDAHPHVCLKIKSVFHGIAPSRTLPFDFPDLPETAHELHWFLQRYPMDISGKDFSRLKRMRKKHLQAMSDVEEILLPGYSPIHVQLKESFTARDYQLRAREIFLKVKRMLLGDDVGLGKTLSATLAFFESRTLPAAVVMQTHMQIQWKEQIEKFTNLRVHMVKQVQPYSLPEADVYLYKYSQLAGWVDVFHKQRFSMAVFDEAQELRRDESQRYAAAKVLSNSVNYCIGLTATPVYNYGDEIFNVMNLIKPGCLGGRDQFLQEWTGSDGRHVQNPAALGTFLRENTLMLRRTRTEVGRELPPVNTIIQSVGYNEAEAARAEELAVTLALKTTTGSFMERGQAARELDALARHTTGVAKAKEVAEFVKILLENNEPVLLAGWHRDVYDIWETELKEYNPVFYTGTESPAQKEKSKQAFISGETNLFIISLRSGIGLDGLQYRCRYVVVGELDWSPKVHHQLIGRADRDGQPGQVTAIYCVCNAGSDPVIVEVLGIKNAQSHGIMDPLLAIPAQHTDQSHIQRLAQYYLKKKRIPEPEGLLLTGT